MRTNNQPRTAAKRGGDKTVRNLKTGFGRSEVQVGRICNARERNNDVCSQNHTYSIALMLESCEHLTIVMIIAFTLTALTGTLCR